MKQILILIAIINIYFASKAQSVKFSGFSSPESVCLVGDKLFVSNVGKELKPMEKDNDGYISWLNKNGEVQKMQWITNLNAPKGLANIKNTLIVADIDRLVFINISTAQVEKEINIDSVKFLNSIAVKNKNTIYVSATDADAIYEVNIETNEVKKTPFKGVNGTNGLHYDKRKKRLYAVGFGNTNYKNGRIGYFDVKTNKPEPIFITNLNGYFDGIKIKGKYAFVSDWGNNYNEGRLLRVDIKHGWINNFAELAGPADFILFGKKIIVPEMKKGNVFIINPNDFFKLFK